MEYTTNMLDEIYNANFVKMFQNIYRNEKNFECKNKVKTVDY